MKQSIKQVKEKIMQEKPRVVFLVGKTCTGKSTFARELESLGYQHVELDLIVRESVRDKFKIKDKDAFTVYGMSAPAEWQQSFEESTKEFLDRRVVHSNLVIDSAIANPEILQRILNNHFQNPKILFFHPFDKEFYYKSIAKRFMDDADKNKISFPIWDHITEEQLRDYKENGIKGKKILEIIKEYADNGIEKSKKRFGLFKSVFPSIILTGH